MFNIDSFAFNRTLIAILDSNNKMVDCNDELRTILDVYHSGECIGSPVINVVGNTPHYLREFFLCCTGSLPSSPVEFENGCLSTFQHSFVIKDETYKYTMVLFIPQDNEPSEQKDSIKLIDELTGFYNSRILDVIQFCQGRILVVKLASSCNPDYEVSDDMIRAFAGLLKESFLSSDVIVRLCRDEFVIMRDSNKNKFYKNILSLKKKAHSFWKVMDSELWFYYGFEKINSCDIYPAILRAKSKIVINGNSYV